jgi:mono/diheme cytochrome c family protein
LFWAEIQSFLGKNRMKQRFRCLPIASACAVLSIAMSGCRQDMQNQPKMVPQRHAAFFTDGRSARPQVAGTVARSERVGASYLTTGLINGAEGSALPFAATYAVLERGQERFNIYCSPCHSRVGNGKGAIVGRGYYAAANFQSTRLQQAPLGHFFWVMTHGYGAMPSYAAELQPEDRWAVAAYIRALQLSQNATSADVPQGVPVKRMGDLLQRASFSRNFLDSWDVSVEDDTSTPAPVASAAPVAPVATVGGPQPASSSATAPKPVEIASAEPAPHGGPQDAQAKPADDKATEKTPPAKAAAKGDEVHGKVVYTNSCAVCHQPTRAGLPPIFPSLIGIVDKDGEAKVRKVAKEGIPDAKPPMPPHPDLTEADLDDLIAFLRSK